MPRLIPILNTTGGTCVAMYRLSDDADQFVIYEYETDAGHTWFDVEDVRRIDPGPYCYAGRSESECLAKIAELRR